MANTSRIAFLLLLLIFIINLIVVVLYKHGDGGRFLGASYNKNRDSETLASGIFVGYLIYTLITLVCSVYDPVSLSSSVIDPLMNAIAFIMWLLTGGVVIHFWIRFIPANHYIDHNPNAAGIAMGALTIVNSLLYLGTTILAYANWRRTTSGQQ